MLTGFTIASYKRRHGDVNAGLEVFLPNRKQGSRASCTQKKVSNGRKQQRRNWTEKSFVQERSTEQSRRRGMPVRGKVFSVDQVGELWSICLHRMTPRWQNALIMSNKLDKQRVSIFSAVRDKAKLDHVIHSDFLVPLIQFAAKLSIFLVLVPKLSETWDHW